MPTYPFAHNGPVYVIYDRKFEIAYYSRLGKKYRRLCDIEQQAWPQTKEMEVDNDTFWTVVKFVEMRNYHA